MKKYSTLDIYMECEGGSLLSFETVLQNVLDLLSRKEYSQLESFVKSCQRGEWGIKGASEASGSINFNKALLVSKKPSKQDPTKFFHDFYIQVKPDSTPVAIKIAFYSPAVFKYLLANADKVQAYVKKSVEVKPAAEDSKDE